MRLEKASVDKAMEDYKNIIKKLTSKDQRNSYNSSIINIYMNLANNAFQLLQFSWEQWDKV